MNYRIAHLSDPHFTNWDWKLKQFTSKRWLGNLNFIFGRRHLFDYHRIALLPELFHSLQVNTVLITGDLSTTSAPKEFETASQFVTLLEKQGIEVLCIPGNHDHYTRKAYRDRDFYKHFPSHWDRLLPYNLKDHGVSAKKIADGWWIVGLDTAIATSWFYSNGFFHPHTEQMLKELLQKIPSKDRVMLINHFPFFLHEPPRKHLIRGEALKQLLEQSPQVKIYCHGHTHRRCLADLKHSGLPLILDPGSVTFRKQGGWHLIDLKTNATTVERYEWSLDQWTPAEATTYDVV